MARFPSIDTNGNFESPQVQEHIKRLAADAMLHRKHPLAPLSLSQVTTGRSMYAMAQRTFETPVGISYGADHGWLAFSEDGWQTKTNLMQGMASASNFVVWKDGTACAVFNDKVVTIDTQYDEMVTTLEPEFAFGGLSSNFYESGDKRYVILGEYAQGNLEPKKLYLSTDGGHTFQVIKETQPGGTINNHWHATAYDPWSGAIWASSGDDLTPPRQVTYSLDLGETWHTFEHENTRHLQPTLIQPLPTRVVFGRDAGAIAPGLDQWKRNEIMQGDLTFDEPALEFLPHLSAHMNYTDIRMTTPGRTADEFYVCFPKQHADVPESYIYGTGDGGISWHLVGSIDRNIHSLGADGNNLFVATTGAVGNRRFLSAPLLTWENS